jgi:hypothetical protein
LLHFDVPGSILAEAFWPSKHSRLPALPYLHLALEDFRLGPKDTLPGTPRDALENMPGSPNKNGLSTRRLAQAGSPAMAGESSSTESRSRMLISQQSLSQVCNNYTDKSVGTFSCTLVQQQLNEEMPLVRFGLVILLG